MRDPLWMEGDDIANEPLDDNLVNYDWEDSDPDRLHDDWYGDD
jgi:hypothetical protein